MTILEVKHLKKYFPKKSPILRKIVGYMKAVDDISFTVNKGEIVALVGESGSGKTTAALASIRLIEPTSGEITLLGSNLLLAKGHAEKNLRLKAQIIFQDPLSSLSPRKSVLDNMGEALLYHRLVPSRKAMIDRVAAILQSIGLPAEAMERYPHEFSGGQQQRISIGRALALSPQLIVCDEIVSALDLSVQAQILTLLRELKEHYGLSYLFISHDLSLMRSFSDYIHVMYQGKIVESGPTEEVFQNPKHPYTQLLLSCIPKNHPSEKRERPPMRPTTAPSETGCPFYGRCSLSKPQCAHFVPPQKHVGDHSYTCIH